MNVSPANSSSTQAVRAPQQRQESKEAAGPDRDRDADDARAQAATKAAVPKGVGSVVDITV